MKAKAKTQKPVRYWLTNDRTSYAVAFWYGTEQPTWDQYWQEWYDGFDCHRVTTLCIDELEQLFPGITPRSGQCVEVRLQLNRLASKHKKEVPR